MGCRDRHARRPRGARAWGRVLEAASACARLLRWPPQLRANGANATGEELNAAGTAAAAPSEWHARDPAERPSSKPKGNPTPAPQVGGRGPGGRRPQVLSGADKEGLRRRRGGARVRFGSTDRRRRKDELQRAEEAPQSPPSTTWLVEHAELWSSRGRRGGGEAREGAAATKLKARRSRTTAPTTATNATVPTTTRFAVPTRAERARALVKQGILPVLETHVRLAKKMHVSSRPSGAARRRRRRGTKTPRAPARRIASAPANRCGRFGSRKPRASGGSVPETRARACASPRDGCLFCAGGAGRRPPLFARRDWSRVRVLARHREVHAREAAGREGRVSLRGRRRVSVRPAVSFLRVARRGRRDHLAKPRLRRDERVIRRDAARLAKCAFTVAAVRRRAPRDGRPGEVRVADASARVSTEAKGTRETNTGGE